MLNFVEAGEERDGDEDDDCFFAVAHFELLDLGREFVSRLICYKCLITMSLIDVDTKNGNELWFRLRLDASPPNPVYQPH